MTSSVYSAGTVSVSNGLPIVAGTDTAWNVALVTGGMFSFAGQSVPIISVESDTSLTLAYPWPGATASGGYAIARETSEAVRATWINDRLAQILTKLSLAGIHPDGAGTLAERNALSPVPAVGYLWLRVEIGYGLDIYRRTASGWDGPFGLTGPEGPAGVLRWIEAGWATATAYEYNDGLTRNGTSYRCFVAHTSGAATEPGVGANWQTVWKVTAAKGDSFRFRGAYSGATAYLANDVVRDGGSSWVALQPTTGNAPPALPATSNAFWELMAVKGQDGTGTGDVVGPVSSVDGQLALFDGPTGKLLKGMVGSPAEGDIMYRGASSWARLPKGAAGQSLRQNTALTAPEWGLAVVPGYISLGADIANSSIDPTNDIDNPPLSCASSDALPILMTIAAGTMQLDVVYGTGNGGRFDAAISDGWWHCFVISNGVNVSRGMSKSLNPTTQPNYPAGYNHYRRIGSARRLAGVFVPFAQDGDRFLYKTPVEDRSSSAATSGPIVITVSVPIGIQVNPIMSNTLYCSGGANVIVRIGGANIGNAAFAWQQIASPGSAITGSENDIVLIDGTFITNTSGQLWYEVQLYSPTLATNKLITWGYHDKRGRAA